MRSKVQTQNNVELGLEFVYLERSHGFNAEVLYTGDTPPSEPKGTIAGMPAGPKRRDLQKEERYKTLIIISGTMIMGLIVALLILVPHRDELSEWLKRQQDAPGSPDIIGWAVGGFLAAVFVGGILGEIMFNRIARRQALPSSLKT